MKTFYSVFIILLVMGSYSLFAEESPEKREFFFNIEAGAASVSYTPETDAMLSDMESAGLDRMPVCTEPWSGSSIGNSSDQGQGEAMKKHSDLLPFSCYNPQYDGY